MTGVNLPLLWRSVFSRTPITKQELAQHMRREFETSEASVDGIGSFESESAFRFANVEGSNILDEPDNVALDSITSDAHSRLRVDSLFGSRKSKRSEQPSHPQRWTNEIHGKWPGLSKMFFGGNTAIQDSKVGHLILN